MLEALIAELASIEDPRCGWKVEHRLIDILVIAVCAVLGEAETFEDIALYGRCKEAWLRGFLALPNGIPSHDTFRRVFTLIDPEAFERSFLGWVRAVFRPEEGAPRQVAIDGKTGPPGGGARPTERRGAARSTGRRAARPCTWSAPTPPRAGWCWRSGPPRARAASWPPSPTCWTGWTCAAAW